MTNTVFGFEGLSANFLLGGGSWNANFPESNLFDDDLTKVARTTDATTGSTVITFTSLTAQSVGVIGLFFNRLGFGIPTDAATIQLELFSDGSFSSHLLNTGAVSAWTGGRNVKDPQWIWWNGTNYSAMSGRITIVDTSNPSGFIDIGYLEIATAVEAPYQFQPGAQRGRRLRSTLTEIPSGRKIPRRRPSCRTFTCTYDATDDATNDLFLAMFEQNDLDIMFIVIPEPDDPSNWGRNAMLCRLTDSAPSASYTAFQSRNQVSVKLEQAL